MSVHHVFLQHDAAVSLCEKNVRLLPGEIYRTGSARRSLCSAVRYPYSGRNIRRKPSGTAAQPLAAPRLRYTECVPDLQEHHDTQPDFVGYQSAIVAQEHASLHPAGAAQGAPVKGPTVIRVRGQHTENIVMVGQRLLIFSALALIT